MFSKLSLSTVRRDLASLSPACTIVSIGDRYSPAYKVRVKGSPVGHGYETNDLQDALDTGKDLSRRNALHGNTILI